MNRIDIKSKLKAKYVTSSELVKIQGIEALEVDLYIKPIKAQQRMRLADKAREYYDITQDDIQNKEIDANSVSAESNYKYMVLLIQMMVCDETGELIFENEKEALDIVDGFPDEILKVIIEQLNGTNAIGHDSAKKPQENLNSTEN